MTGSIKRGRVIITRPRFFMSLKARLPQPLLPSPQPPLALTLSLSPRSPRHSLPSPLASPTHRSHPSPPTSAMDVRTYIRTHCAQLTPHSLLYQPPALTNNHVVRTPSSYYNACQIIIVRWSGDSVFTPDFPPKPGPEAGVSDQSCMCLAEIMSQVIRPAEDRAAPQFLKDEPEDCSLELWVNRLTLQSMVMDSGAPRSNGEVEWMEPWAM